MRSSGCALVGGSEVIRAVPLKGILGSRCWPVSLCIPASVKWASFLCLLLPQPQSNRDRWLCVKTFETVSQNKPSLLFLSFCFELVSLYSPIWPCLKLMLLRWLSLWGSEVLGLITGVCHHARLSFPLFRLIIFVTEMEIIYTSICPCLYLSIRSSQFKHFAANVKLSFFLMVEYYCVACIDHVFFTWSSLPGFCFGSWEYCCSELGLQISFWDANFSSFGYHSRNGVARYMVVLVLVLGGTSVRFPLWLHCNQHHAAGPSLHILGNIYLLFIDNHYIHCGEVLVLWFWFAFPSWLVIRTPFL